MPLVPPSAAPVRTTTTTTTTSEDVKRMPEPPACPDAHRHDSRPARPARRARSGPNRALTPPMRATPRARLRERALRGWWPRFPVSPAGSYGKFRRNVEVADFVSCLLYTSDAADE